jgi:hypothetical protein
MDLHYDRIDDTVLEKLIHGVKMEAGRCGFGLSRPYKG